MNVMKVDDNGNLCMKINVRPMKQSLYFEFALSPLLLFSFSANFKAFYYIDSLQNIIM